MRLLINVLIVGWAMALSATAAAAETRVALVIGNSAYANTVALTNPVNDARAMTASLKATGFEVIEALDADKKKLDGALRLFTDKLIGADVALFYYAGHGLQVGLQNYLVPTDARLERERDLEFEAVKLDFVLRQMEIEREGKTTIVILDACRDNPLARTLGRSMGTRSAGIGRGLAAASTGLGTFIAYATQPGNVALDGAGQNSPFTASLAKHMPVKGRNLPATMIEVRKDVVAATDGKQVPWDHSALTGDFYFLPDTGAPAQGAVSPAPAGSNADLAALQARLAKLEREAKERESAPKSAAPSPAPSPAVAQADAAKLADLRERAAKLDELVKSLEKKLAGRQKSAQSPNADAIESEIIWRTADLQKLKVEIAALEGGAAQSAKIAANIPPVLPKAKPQKVSPDFEETDNVGLMGVEIRSYHAPSPIACREDCQKDAQCVGFQHGKKAGNMGTCELFSRLDARREDPTWRSGVRRSSNASPAQ